MLIYNQSRFQFLGDMRKPLCLMLMAAWSIACTKIDLRYEKISASSYLLLKQSVCIFQRRKAHFWKGTFFYPVLLQRSASRFCIISMDFQWVSTEPQKSWITATSRGCSGSHQQTKPVFSKLAVWHWLKKDSPLSITTTSYNYKICISQQRTLS